MITNVERLEDSEEENNDTSSFKVKCSSRRRLGLGNKRRREAQMVLDVSEEDCAGNYRNKNKVESHKKIRRRRAQILEDDTDVVNRANFDKDLAKKKKVIEQTIKSATRLGKRLFGKKSKGSATENSTKIDTMKDSTKGSKGSKQKKRTAATQV